MDMKDFIDKVGRTYLLPISTGSHTIRVRVRVDNMRTRYGNVDASIVPLDGDGTAWVEFSRLVPEDVTA